MVEKTRFYIIDAVKAFCALLVIVIHTQTPYRESLQPITACAVPCFFMISGFCLWGKRDEMQNRLFRAIKRIIYILLWSSLLYLPLALFFANQIKNFDAFSKQALFDLVVNCVHPFACHLWYLVAYLYVLGTLWIFNKFFNSSMLLYTCIPLFFLNCLPLSYCQNFVSKALPFVLLGMIIKLLLNDKCIIDIDNKNHSTSLVRYIMPFSIIGCRYSLYIYIFHIWVKFVWEYVLNKYILLPDFYTALLHISPLIIFVLSLLLSAFLKKLRILGNVI